MAIDTTKTVTGLTYNGVELEIAGGAEPVISPLTVTQNGVYTAPTGIDGYNPVTVDTPFDVSRINRLYGLYGVNNDGTNGYPTDMQWPESITFTHADRLFDISNIACAYVGWHNTHCKIKHWTFDLSNNTADKFAVTNAFRRNPSVETVTFLGGTPPLADNSYGAFSECSNLRGVYGVIRVNHRPIFSIYNFITSCPMLEDIELDYNCTPDDNFSVAASSKLTDASIVSIANSLWESASGRTLTLHATPKARCSTIMGTVTLSDDDSYHIFTVDASGSTSLADFITQVKGWTLA